MKISEQVDMNNLPMFEKAKLATVLGDEVGKILNRALTKCNKMLKRYRYSVSLTLNFHDLDEIKQKEKQ